MTTFPKLNKRDIREIAQRIVQSTDAAFTRLDQQPIVRIVADHPKNYKRLEAALRKKWHTNVAFCRVAPEKALVVVATFTVELLACSHCRAPYEEGHVRIELTRRGRTVVLKPTDAEIWICPKCGIED